MRSDDGSAVGPTALAVGIFAACLINAAVFTAYVSNPVIARDAWYFLDTFLGKHLDGTLKWTDYFVKRGANDSSLPLQKLLMVLNADWLDLDFRYEALAGLLGMVVCCGYLIAIGQGRGRRQLTMRDACLVCLIPLFLFSLNSVEIYEWSLVMSFNLVLPLALVLFSSAHATGGGRRALMIFAAAFACLLVMDNGGLLLGLAAAAALAFEILRGAEWRGAVARMSPIGLGIVCYYAARSWVVPSFAGGRPEELAGSFRALMAQPGQTWKGLVVPAAASVVDVDSFGAIFGRLGDPMMVAVGLVLLSLHAAFWVSSFRTPAGNRSTFVAVGIMLFVYGATAGVIVERVPQYGWKYLEQHRYIVFYQLANIAMVLQWLATRQPSHSPRRFLPAVAVAAVVLLEARLSAHAWQQVQGIREYHKSMAQTVFCLADHPDIQAPVCEALHSVCGWSPEVRNHLVGILKQHRLNVFSEKFQRRHAMRPLPDQDDRCLPPPPLVVNDIVDVRLERNPATGDTVIGSILGTGFRQGDMVIVNNGAAVGTVLGNQSWMTFSIPASTVTEHDAITLSVVRPSTSERSQNITVTVRR